MAVRGISTYQQGRHHRRTTPGRGNACGLGMNNGIECFGQAAAGLVEKEQPVPQQVDEPGFLWFSA